MLFHSAILFDPGPINGVLLIFQAFHTENFYLVRDMRLFHDIGAAMMTVYHFLPCTLPRMLDHFRARDFSSARGESRRLPQTYSADALDMATMVRFKNSQVENVFRLDLSPCAIFDA